MSGTFNRVRFSSRRGFTLVELLVVIAIIALLVSILVPTLGKAKHAVRLLTCMTNMHAIGGAASMYAADNKLYLPRDAAWTDPTQHNPDVGWYFWASRFSPYMDGPKIPLNKDVERTYVDPIFKNIKAYRCPSFKDKRYMLTYVTNAWNFDNPVGWENQGSPARPLSNLTRAPAEVGYIMEFNHLGSNLNDPEWQYLYGCYDCLGYVMDDGGIRNFDLTFDEDGLPAGLYGGWYSGRMIRVDDERHQGRTTLIFFDGHAEKKWLEPEELPLQMFFAYP